SQRDQNRKDGSFLPIALVDQLAPMLANDAERREQTHSGPASFGRVVGLEEVVTLLVVETRTGVGNRQTAIATPPCADRDRHGSAVLYGLQGVDQQRGQHIAQKDRVRTHINRSRLNREGKASPLGGRTAAYQLCSTGGDVVQADRFQSDFDPRACA